MVTAYEFTTANQIAPETTTGPDGSTPSAREYTYDPAGNLTTRTDHVHNSDTNQPETITTGYIYDAYSRLVLHHPRRDHTTAPVTQRTDYTVTVSGDITTETVTTHPDTPDASTTREFGYTATGQLRQVTTTHPDTTVTVASRRMTPPGTSPPPWTAPGTPTPPPTSPTPKSPPKGT